MGFMDKLSGAVNAISPFAHATGQDVGAMIPGIGDKQAADAANKANLAESKLNRAFQERMSNTAYQRGMNDMKKAGLNPTLAFMQGGASSPSGSTANVTPASASGLGDFALKATTGMGTLKTQQTAVQQQQSMNESSIKLNAATAAKHIADVDRTRAETAKTKSETKGLGRKEAEGDLWSKFYKGIGNMLNATGVDARNMNKTEPPLIKKQGNVPHPPGISDWLFKNKRKN